ncbi:hypothetical protein FDECE_5046 [Fusarium decemcellulare]|nr:hypothetical protein FDECE_5046 [Fusarium decemcellulare]
MALQPRPGPTLPSSAEAQGAAQGPQSTATQASHEIQLRYKLASPTFKTLCTISHSPARRDILQTACLATEFRSFPIKQAERAFFRAVNDSTGIPYPIPENISQPWHKVFLLVQLNLLKIEWPNKISGPARKELYQEVAHLSKLLDPVLRCIADILGERGHGRGLRTALDVLRSVKAGVWEGSENELLQVDGIGVKKMGRLVHAKVKSIKKLAQLEFYHIERLLSHNPPFGQKLLHKLAGFPVLELDFEIISQYTPTMAAATSSSPNEVTGSTESLIHQSSTKSLWIARVILSFTNKETPSWNGHTPWLTLVVEGHNGQLVWFWRGSSKRLVGGKEMIIGLGVKKGEELKITFACEEIVGTTVQMSVEV